MHIEYVYRGIRYNTQSYMKYYLEGPTTSATFFIMTSWYTWRHLANTGDSLPSKDASGSTSGVKI